MSPTKNKSQNGAGTDTLLKKSQKRAEKAVDDAEHAVEHGKEKAEHAVEQGKEKASQAADEVREKPVPIAAILVGLGLIGLAIYFLRKDR